jgi:corrinoid protein of di/trimethylamine methyltransferase
MAGFAAWCDISSREAPPGSALRATDAASALDNADPYLQPAQEENMADLRLLYDAILNGDAKAAVSVAREALAENVQPMDLITGHLVPAMDEVGRRFECQEFFVPELLLSARAMKGVMELLQPLLAAAGARPIGRVVIGTVKGDLHDIGKNLVASMLQGGGFEIFDLGADVPPEKFVAAVRERQAQIVCLSALVTVTMPAMKATIEALRNAGLREQVTILVGGAPLTDQYAREIGADGYGESATEAVTLARRALAGA